MGVLMAVKMQTIQHRRIVELHALAKGIIKKFSRVIDEDLDMVHKELIKSRDKEKVKHLFAMLFLKSTLPTIRIISQLIDIGHYDEASVLMRMVLEKAALVFKGLKDNLSINEIEKLQGNRCVSSLKEHFDIGKMYGGLSAITHAKPIPYIYFAILKGYNTKRSKNNYMKSGETRLVVNILFCHLMAVLLAVTKFLGRDYLKTNSGWSLLENNKWNYAPTITTSFGSLPGSLLKVYKLYVKSLK